MKKISNYMLLILFSCFCASVLAALLYLFYYAFTSSNSSFGIAFASAFAGAFFVFLFERVAAWLNLLKVTADSKYLAFIKFQFVLNQQLNIINHNIFTIEDIASTLKKAADIKNPKINPNLFQLYAVDFISLSELSHKDFINDLIKYYVDFDKCNESLKVNDRFYSMLINKYFGSSDPRDLAIFTENSKVVFQQNDIVKPFLNALRDRNIELRSRLSVLLERKPLYRHITQLISRNRYGEKFLMRAKHYELKMREQLMIDAHNNREIIKATLDQNQE